MASSSLFETIPVIGGKTELDLYRAGSRYSNIKFKMSASCLAFDSEFTTSVTGLADLLLVVVVGFSVYFCVCVFCLVFCYLVVVVLCFCSFLFGFVCCCCFIFVCFFVCFDCCCC